MTAAPHRLALPLRPREPAGRELAGGACTCVARYSGTPLFALDLGVAPIWAHSFLMLFTVLPTFFLGFLFTTYPRWMNGPLVPRLAYVAAPLLLTAATACWLVGVHTGSPLQLVAAPPW